MRMKTIAEVINETLPFATRSVLAQSRIHLTEARVDRPVYDLIALIGFSGDEGLVGTVGFATEQSILKAEYDESETYLSEGWLGEIVNQLLGRLKNALLPYGLEINLQLPKVLHGIRLQIGSESNQVKHYMYTSEFGRCCTWVDANWDLNRNLQLAVLEEQVQSEGDMILF